MGLCLVLIMIAFFSKNIAVFISPGGILMCFGTPAESPLFDIVDSSEQ